MNSATAQTNKLLAQAFQAHNASRPADTEALCREILQTEPQRYEALILLGVALGNQGKLESALEFIRKAASSAPSSAESWHDLGQLFLHLQEFHEAINALEKSVAFNPSFANAQYTLGKAQLEAGALEKAAISFQSVIDRQHSHPHANAGLDTIRRASANIDQMARLWKGLSNSNQKTLQTPGETTGLLKRDYFPHVLNQLGLTGIGVEIGVKAGLFSEHLLANWNGRLLYSIDPWRHFSKDQYVDIANVEQQEHDRYYLKTLKRLLPFESRSVVWRLTSMEATELIPDQSLDFCYIDGDHSFQGVCNDIESWYPKIKPGGILSGHDYVPDGKYHFGEFGVKGAVDQFVQRENLPLQISIEPAPICRSWFVVKPSR